jgi:hypothetical protein
MSRRAIWSALVTALLGTLAALWFLDHFEQVPVKTHEGMQQEARRNPLLAAERLFSRLGRTVKRCRRSADLGVLGGNDALILVRGPGYPLSRETTQSLLQWVERGGYLIVDWEFSDRDFLAEAFGVELAKPSPGKDGTPPGGGMDARHYVEVALPGEPARYRLAAGFNGLAAGKVPPQWRAAGPHGDSILHYARGRGNVTLLNYMSFLGNANLGDYDHAELAWALLQRYQPGGAVNLAARLEHPTLWQWLAESAWSASASVAALVVLWLWSAVPRFGGMRATPDAARRDLAQHLLAIGRCLWREGGLAHLRGVARQEVARCLALRHPALSRRLAGERQAGLARLAGLDPGQVREALADHRPPSPEDFTRTMRILQRLEQKL